MSFFRLRPAEYESEICAFVCPRCGSEAQFLRVRLAYGISIAGIPVFPVKTLAEYVRCNDCNADMKAEELMLPVDQLEALEMPWKCLECTETSSPTASRCVACAAPRPMKRLAPRQGAVTASMAPTATAPRISLGVDSFDY